MSIELLIIADDLTGALDTGVKFSARGISSYVIPSFPQKLFDAQRKVQVLIVNAESRHLSAKDAYNRVFQAAGEATACGIPHIYKKTDSALRGNIGAELSALLDASREKLLPFLPAYPLMNRVTKDGYHFINGVPVSKSPFGSDPFDPVTQSYLPDILAMQSDTPVLVCEPDFAFAPNGRPAIAVFNAETDDDLRRAGQTLSHGSFKISAGCAGFATVLPDLLHIAPKALTLPPVSACTLYTCGSVSPITIEQINMAEKAGIPVFEADDGIICDDFASSDAGKALAAKIISALERDKKALLASVVRAETLNRRRLACEAAGNKADLRVNISRNLGCLTRAIADKTGNMNFVIFGGDTLSEVMRAAGLRGLTPASELFPGVVLAEADGAAGNSTIITKSGGFGGADIVLQIDVRLNELTFS